MDLRSLLNQPREPPARKDARGSHESPRPLSYIQTDHTGASAPLASPYSRHPSQSSGPFSASSSNARHPSYGYQTGSISTPTASHAPTYPSPGHAVVGHSPASTPDRGRPAHQLSPVLSRHQTYPEQHHSSQNHVQYSSTPDRIYPTAIGESSSRHSSWYPPPVDSHAAPPGFHAARSLHTGEPIYLPGPHAPSNDRGGYDSTHHVSHEQNRQQSVSVSPKTILAPLPSQDTHLNAAPSFSASNSPPISSHGQLPQPPAHSQVTQTDDRYHPVMPRQTSSSEIRPEDVQKPRPSLNSSSQPTSGGGPSSRTVSSDTLYNHAQPDHNLSPQAPVSSHVPEVKQSAPLLKRPASSSEADGASRPAKRPKRYREVPIWAQRCKATPPLPKYRTTVNQNGPIKPNGHASASIRGPRIDQSEKPLGPWEPSITNVFPYEEVERSICDFLFLHVVQNHAVKAGDAGSIPSGEAQVEIEAKIGTIIDRLTNTRIRLPVVTETMLAEDTDISFESNMTEIQHKRYNDYLNTVVKDSLTQAHMTEEQRPKRRIPVQYKHLREVDTFYELPAAEILLLPAAIREQIQNDPRQFKPRVRVTTDQKTDKVLAKIIKARVKDLHIFSPRCDFDWRVSVNLEMNWDGDLQALIASQPAGHRLQSRRKDRMSYKHLFCQIDLTQVKTHDKKQNLNEPGSHELEVELASSEVRRQGELLMNNQEHQYEELVKSLADNVRILTRLK